MYHSIEYLDNGTKDGAIDWRVAGYLASRIDYKKLQVATLYVRVKTSIKDIAEYLRVHPNRVKDSLYRLQDQSRVYITEEPRRGRNYLLLNIGIDSKGKKTGKKDAYGKNAGNSSYGKTKVLFAPALTIQVIWSMTMDNIKKAESSKDKIRLLGYLLRVAERMPEGEREARMQKIKEKIKQFEGSTPVPLGSTEVLLGSTCVLP